MMIELLHEFDQTSLLVAIGSPSLFSRLLIQAEWNFNCVTDGDIQKADGSLRKV